MSAAMSAAHSATTDGPTHSLRREPACGFNDAGFGDTIHGNGPLAGGQAGFNWQTGSWVLGLKAAWSKTDLRGENTCYSGVGGLNCQNIINNVGTVTGRLGYAWDRAMVYAEGGAARGQIDYMLLGDTNNQGRGYGVTRISPWGWAVGGDWSTR